MPNNAGLLDASIPITLEPIPLGKSYRYDRIAMRLFAVGHEAITQDDVGIVSEGVGLLLIAWRIQADYGRVQGKDERIRQSIVDMLQAIGAGEGYLREVGLIH